MEIRRQMIDKYGERAEPIIAPANRQLSRTKSDRNLNVSL